MLAAALPGCLLETGDFEARDVCAKDSNELPLHMFTHKTMKPDFLKIPLTAGFCMIPSQSIVFVYVFRMLSFEYLLLAIFGLKSTKMKQIEQRRNRILPLHF
ncbi:MAG TPA: hypothetical protein VGB45_00225 [Abditibacterium sp.]